MAEPLARQIGIRGGGLAKPMPFGSDRPPDLATTAPDRLLFFAAPMRAIVMVTGSHDQILAALTAGEIDLATTYRAVTAVPIESTEIAQKDFVLVGAGTVRWVEEMAQCQHGKKTMPCGSAPCRSDLVSPRGIAVGTRQSKPGIVVRVAAFARRMDFVRSCFQQQVRWSVTHR